MQEIIESFGTPNDAMADWCLSTFQTQHPSILTREAVGDKQATPVSEIPDQNVKRSPNRSFQPTLHDFYGLNSVLRGRSSEALCIPVVPSDSFPTESSNSITLYRPQVGDCDTSLGSQDNKVIDYPSSASKCDGLQDFLTSHHLHSIPMKVLPSTQS